MSPKKRRRSRRLEPLEGQPKRYRISITEYDRKGRTFKSIGVHATFNAESRAQIKKGLWPKVEATIQRGEWRKGDDGDDADAGGGRGKPEGTVIVGA